MRSFLMVVYDAGLGIWATNALEPFPLGAPSTMLIGDHERKTTGLSSPSSILAAMWRSPSSIRCSISLMGIVELGYIARMISRSSPVGSNRSGDQRVSTGAAVWSGSAFRSDGVGERESSCVLRFIEPTELVGQTRHRSLDRVQ